MHPQSGSYKEFSLLLSKGFVGNGGRKRAKLRPRDVFAVLHNRRTRRQNLAPSSGDNNGVLELGGKLPVGGEHGPIVIHALSVIDAEVHHRLDGEDPAFLHLFAATVGVVRHLGRHVKLPPDTVANVVPNHRAAPALGVLLNCRTDVAHVGPVANLGDANLQRLARGFDHPLRILGGGTDVEGHARVAVKAMFLRQVGGDIDVHDVAVPQHVVPGDAVAHAVVDAGADALGERATATTAAVAEGGRIGIRLGDHLVHERVDGFGRDPRSDHLADRHEALRRQLSGLQDSLADPIGHPLNTFERHGR